MIEAPMGEMSGNHSPKFAVKDCFAAVLAVFGDTRQTADAGKSGK